MVEFLTKETFLAKVYDFENNKDWKYKGDKPALIDFYAEIDGKYPELGIDKSIFGKTISGQE